MQQAQAEEAAATRSAEPARVVAGAVEQTAAAAAAAEEADVAVVSAAREEAAARAAELAGLAAGGPSAAVGRPDSAPKRPLSSLSVDEVGALLCHLDLGKHADASIAESVNGAHLSGLLEPASSSASAEDDLRELGMKLGMRRKAFLKRLAQFLQRDGVTPPLLGSPVDGESDCSEEAVAV